MQEPKTALEDFCEVLNTTIIFSEEFKDYLICKAHHISHEAFERGREYPVKKKKRRTK